MADKQPSKPGTSASLFAFPLPDAGCAMMTLVHAQSAAMRALLVQQRELFGFLNQRWDADIQLLDQIEKADGVPKLVELVTDFGQRTATDYSEEAHKLGDLGARTASESVDRIQRESITLAERVLSAPATQAA